MNHISFRKHSLAIDLDLLFLVDHIAMEDIREFELVSSGPIAVQHNLSVSQQLLPNRGPITLGNGTWSWGPLPSDPGIESEESERGRATPLHQTTPLFPSCVVGAVAGFISALADVYFINLHVLPIAAIRDEIFLGCDVPRPRDIQVRVDALHWFVIHVKDQMGGLTGHIRNSTVKGCGLLVERCDGVPCTHEEDGMKVMWLQVLVALLGVAAVCPHILAVDVGQLAQGAVATTRTGATFPMA